MLIVSTFKTPAGGLEVVYDEHYIYRSSFTTATTNKSEGPLGILIEEQIAAIWAVRTPSTTSWHF